VKIRVLVADDHTLLLDGIRLILEPEFDLVGSVEDGQALLTAAQQLKPDVILLDISMPKLNGIDAARQLRKLHPSAKIIFVTMHSDADYVSEAFRAGACGYILKRSAATEVLQLVAEGRTRKEIAAVLNISVKTVEFHKAALMRDLNLHSGADFTRYAIEHGLIVSERSSNS
jgi:DNA-binding NarL/FixJ family response regulator